MSVSLTGNDSISINGRVLADFADGDIANLDFPNNLVEAKTGKNNNTIYAFNATGRVVTATVRLIRGSSDDKFLNSEMNSFINDPASYLLLESEFIKRVGDGQGTITQDVYRLSGGVIHKLPTVKENVEGDVESAVVVWEIQFANTDRTII